MKNVEIHYPIGTIVENSTDLSFREPVGSDTIIFLRNLHGKVVGYSSKKGKFFNPIVSFPLPQEYTIPSVIQEVDYKNIKKVNN